MSAHFRRDRRNKAEPVPENLQTYLTEEQEKALPVLAKKGVSLFAVRRPLFQDATVIVELASKGRYGVLLENGDVDYFPDLILRERNISGIQAIFSNRGNGAR